MNADSQNIHFALAPMEGVVDAVVRDVYTQIGGMDHCVTEFLRVTNQLLPDKVFFQTCPELKNSSRTMAGVPVVLQLLGGHAEPLAQNAARAVQLGAYGIDLNFGCPAKTVNRHDGGATLLKYPKRIYEILKTVRQTVPANIAVTAKIRLGFDEPSACLENALAVKEAGIQILTVHCRTKTDFYKPPAYWEWIPRIRDSTGLDIVANGDIFTVADFLRCRAVTGCHRFMLGRGAMANPFLFLQIRQALTALHQGASEAEALVSVTDWRSVSGWLLPFFDKNVEHRGPAYAVARTKQWLVQLAKSYHEARLIFDRQKVMHNAIDFRAGLCKEV